MKNSKKIIVMMIVLVIGLVYIINKPSNNKNVLNNKQEEPKVREKMAIKVENDNGDYVFASKFPGKGYVINNDMTECVDQAGNKVDGVSFSSDGTSVTVTSKYTAYCTLYFSKTESLGKFCNDQTNMGTCMNNKKSTIGKVENMTSSEVGGMYRYQGTDEVNNWICFGTSDKTTCTNDIDKYMYRIIGVTPDGQLALIKETGIKEGTTNTFKWNDKYLTSDCGTNGENCTWANSKIYNRLNGLCKTENSECNGTGEGTSGQTNIFINSTYYEYLNNNSEWLNKIDETHKWKYGDTTSDGNYNGDTIYKIEDAFTSNIQAKIGLQYIHDYYYAYPGGNPGNRSDAKNTWIHLSKDGNSGILYEWLISRYGVSSTIVYAWYVYSSGFVYNYLLDYYIGVRPVFYLKSDIEISSTAGSKDDPFMIT